MTSEILKNEYGISEKLLKLSDKIEAECSARFKEVDEVAEFNQLKILRAFQRVKLSPAHFAPSYGYGYSDIGREKLEELYCAVFNCEAAIVRPAIASGTHALAIGLFGLLKQGDLLVSASGAPYDTLESAIGISGDEPGSLKELGVTYKQVDLTENGLNYEAIAELCQKERPAVVMLQKSRGYSSRNSLSVGEIEKAVKVIKRASSNTVVFIDNCYGEFVETVEPTEAGADIVVGSLIKNPGGGLAPTGGYIVGKKALIDRIANRLTSPGIGAEVGSYAASYLPFFQGLYLAPNAVGQALKGAIFAAALFENLGYKVSPGYMDRRSCIIQSVYMQNKEEVIKFCQAIQKCSPVESHVIPEPWAMPGYQDEVIMAAGTFIQGASIELSADAPIRPPYLVFLQGGLVYAQVKAAVLTAAQRLML